jgi:hypothetical protein
MAIVFGEDSQLISPKPETVSGSTVGVKLFLMIEVSIGEGKVDEIEDLFLDNP